MRIENIDARGIMAENGLFATEGKQVVREDKKIEEGVTRIAGSLSVPCAGYDLGSLTNNAAKDEAVSAISAESDKAAMEKMAKVLGADDYEELRSNDFSPEAMEERRITTVVDKMQLEMAKAGLDISKLASDLDAKDIEAITGSAASAGNIETAMKKAEEIAKSGELTEGETDYLLSNELEPTIDNVYAAKFSGANADNGRNPQNGRGGAYTPAALPKNTEFEAVQGDAEKIIKNAGLDVTEETLGEARYLFENNLPVTEDNVKLLDSIYNEDLITDNNAVASAIVDAALEGRNPGEAYMLPGYSAMDRARDFKDFVDNATPEQIAARDNIDDITARRILEETRLAMSVEANFSLIKRGIAIDTQPLAQVVEELKAQEQAYYSAVFNMDIDDADAASEGLSGISADMIASFNDTNTAIDMLKQSPAYTIGQVDIKSATLDEAKNVGWDLKDRFDRANETYEALGTSPRADLGDSMKKAFRNVNDILGDLGMDASNENQRAVRILAYNHMEINEESVLTMKEADETVQRAFRSLTPAVVAEMVKSGVNPLDMTMPELAAKAADIKAENNIDNDSERFARFLVKLDQNKEISQEERSAYIGIYRLISRVEATDGAAIGSLLLQDRDITMRNLMTAVRTGKKAAKGLDESVDDERGYVEVNRSELTITQQIEINIAFNQLANAGEMMTPAMLANVAENAGNNAADPEKLLDMTPAELLSQLEENAESDDVKSETKAYAEDQIEDIRQAAKSDDEIYDMLKNLSLPVTVQNLQAAAMFMNGRNKMFTDLMEKAEQAEEKDPDIRALIEKCIQEFGEDSKTPAEMAQAQEALAELAEHAMDGYITEEEVNTVDLKGMKLTRTVAHFMKEMAKSDSYNLPIKVNDATGNVSIKIVHGEEKQGLVTLSFFCEQTGDVKGSLHYTKDLLDWELTAEEDAIKDKLEEKANLLDDILAKEAEKRDADADVTDNDLTRIAGRVLEFLKNLAEEG